MYSLQGIDLGGELQLAFWEAAFHTQQNESDLQSFLARWNQVSATGLPSTLDGYKTALYGLCLLCRPDLAMVRFS